MHPFKKVLIANRGEIACRIIRTCRRLGTRTVAVYSDADRGALHVQMADEACFIGNSPSSESYLNIRKIIEAAKISGAQAIHPGYGFLSENPGLAIACLDAGVKFIGPAPGVLQAMGDKIKARELAVNAGLPVISGSRSEVADHQAMDWAKVTGFPLMVKAASGGGGIGMQVVRKPEELMPIIERGRQLAQKAFGSPSLYFEQYLENASHIEVQVIANEEHHAVHLFERDCSVQRRSQKIVEETPSSKLDDRLRKTITHYALNLVRHTGYTNAGTVEFLVSREGRIYFLEMNKRLQVEHGITEMLTGTDIVEMQLRIACGEPLPCKQQDISARGVAIEARIYAENPETFLPSTGRVTRLQMPKESKNLRIDTCLYPGYEVTIFYDALLAKLMCWDQTREQALNRLVAALKEFQVEGVSTNIPFLQSVLASPDFTSRTYDTSLVSKLVAAAKGRAAAVASPANNRS